MNFDPNQLMRQVAKMQADMAKAQEELADQRVEATAGGGMVRVTASGTGEIVAVKLSKEAVDPDDVEMLEDMVLAAVNEASRSAQALQQSRMQGLTGGLGLPGL